MILVSTWQSEKFISERRKTVRNLCYTTVCIFLNIPPMNCREFLHNVSFNDSEYVTRTIWNICFLGDMAQVCGTFQFVCEPGLWSRRFLGGVGFLTTLWVGVGFFYRLRMYNWIVFYITLLNWEFLLHGTSSFETFVETDFLLCTTISIDFNSRISIPLC